MTQEKSGWLEVLSREAWAIAIAASVLGIALLPRNAAALTALIVAALWPLLLASLRFRDATVPTRRSLIALAIAAAPVLVIVVRSLFALDARVSLVGSVGQHAGSLLWLVALCVTVSAAISARPGDLGRVSRSFAVAGAVLAAAGVLDRMGAFASIRFSTEPSGIMENSVSLGQVLIVATGCAVAWMLSSRSTVQRASAAVSLVALLGGLFVADSAGAWVGLIVGVLVAVACLLLARAGFLKSALVAAVLTALVAAGIVALLVMLSNGVQPGIESKMADAANNRFRIWTSAVAQIADAPIVGEGTEQFSALVIWDIDPGPALRKTATYDPHNLGLWWLLGGGALGALLALGAMWALTERSLALLSAKPAMPVAALFGSTVAWVTASMFSWTSPLALTMVAAVAGLLVAAVPAPAVEATDDADDAEVADVAEVADPASPRAPRSGAIALAVIAAIGVAITVGLFVAGATYEYDWARSVDRGQPDGGALVLAAVRTGDPSLASIAVQSLMARVRTGGEGPQEVRTLTQSIVPILERSSVWHVDSAFELFTLEIVDVGAKTDTEWDDVGAALARGKKADPTTAFWDAVGSLQAETMGFAEQAKTLRDSALKQPLPPGARAVLMEKAAQ